MLIEVLPHVKVHLCVFHVLKATRKEIVKIVPKNDQKEVFTLVHALVYAHSEEEFAKVREKLERFPALYSYLSDNWLNCRADWAILDRGEFLISNLVLLQQKCKREEVQALVTPMCIVSEYEQ
jgi:transposase-like protein